MRCKIFILSKKLNHPNSACVPDDPQCGLEGLCVGNMFHNGTVDSPDDCLSDCKSTKDCQWFSFAKFNESERPSCYLYYDCATLEVDESCMSCISGEQRCPSSTETTTEATTSTISTPPSSGRFLFSNVKCRSCNH